ncbi:spinster family MFS transporter [Sphingomonas canadensis]|uniref:Spinster family MFS transporter n=1 Tax=Sphingomonas canadensis TaxID=1219257 RepID=A0ABW3H2L0_9SPHN|nr:MFS transporter [Sphingomonas canadensis]MCW3834482.1 MFS transporter [Sphingomonas canadensis]
MSMANEQDGEPGRGPLRATAPAYVLTLLTAVSFFNYLDRMVIAVLVEPIKAELGLSDSQLGLVVGFAFAMLYATLGLPLARIADRRSRVTLISICLVLWSGMTAVTGLVRNFTELFLARVGVGVGEAGCAPAAHSLLGDIYPRERRAFAVSMFQAGGTLGQSVGLALAAIVAQFWGWRAALVVVGLCGIPLAVLMYFTVREPLRSETHARDAAEPMRATLRSLFVRPTVIHLVFGISIAAFGSYGMSQWLPAFFIRLHGLTLGQVGLYIGMTGAVGAVLGTVFGGFMLTRLGRRDVRWELWWPMLVFALFPLLMLPSFLTPDWRVALGFQVVAFFVGASGGGVAMSAMQTYVEPHRRATAIALILLSSSLLGLGLGPVAVGVISDLLAPSLGAESLRYGLIAMLFMPFWAAVHFYLAARSSRKWSLD